MSKAKIKTGWAGTGTEADPYRPAISSTFGVVGFTDLSGAPPGTPEFEVEIEAPESVLDAIRGLGGQFIPPEIGRPDKAPKPEKEVS